MADSDVEVRFGANIEALVDGVTKVRESIESVVEPVNHLKEAFGGITEALAGALALEKIDGFIEGLIHLNDESKNAALVMGLSLDQVAGFQAAAEAAGVPVDGLTAAFTRLSATLATDSKPAQRALDFLGLSLKQLDAESPVDRFEDVGAAMMNVADAGSRDAATIVLYGRSFRELLPIFAEGKGALAEWQETAEELGATLTRASASIDQTSDEMNKMGLAFRGAGIDVFLEFHGVVDGAIKLVTDLAADFHNAMTQGGLFKDAMDGLATALKVAESGVILFIAGLQSLWAAGADVLDQLGILFMDLGKEILDDFKGVAEGLGNFFHELYVAGEQSAEALGQVFANVGNVIGNAVTGHFSEAGAAFDKLKSDAANAGNAIGDTLKSSLGAFDFKQADADEQKFHADSIDRTKQYATSIVGTYRQMLAEISTVWEGTAAAAQKNTPTNTGQFNNSSNDGSEAARQQLEATLEAMNQEIEAVQKYTQAKIEAFDDAAKHGMMSNAQLLQSTEDYLQDELQDEQAIAQQELALKGLTTRQKETIDKNLLNEEEANAEAVFKAQQKSADDTLDQWQKTFTTINSAFADNVVDVLKGTESIAAGFHNMFASLLTDLIKWAVESALKVAENTALHLAGIGTVTAATQAGTALQLSSAAEGAAVQKTLAASSISTDAAQAAAGAYAATAQIPIIGPFLAPAAAAVAYGATEAFGSFDQGSWSIPADMLAMVHRNEVVLPTGGPAETFRAAMMGAVGVGDGSSGGGGDTHIHISAIDAGGVRQLFKNHSSELYDALEAGRRKGHHLRLSRAS